jgi:hypothetical protein
MKRLFILLFVFLIPAISTFSQFLTGDCCTCYAYEYGSQKDFYRDSSIYLIRNRETGNWEESSFSKYTYNNGRLEKTFGFYFDKDIYKRIKSYLQIKNPVPGENNLERLTYRWNRYFQNWKESSRSVSYYNEDHKLSHSINFKFDENTISWVNSTRIETLSDSENASTSHITKKWIELSGTWMENSENKCTDDLANLVRTCYTTSLNEETGAWETTRKTLYQYNTNMRIAEMFLYDKDKESNMWKPLHHSKYEYDETGRKISWYSWSYDKNSGEEKASGHQKYMYDDHGNNSEVQSLSFNKTTNEWTVYRRQINYWSKLTETKSMEVLSGTLIVYPNPFADQALLSLSGITNIKKIELLNLNGKLVRNYEVEDHIKELVIEKNELMPGMYIIKVYADKIYTGRMVIR